MGIFLLMQGINSIELGINMPHEKKSYVKIYKRQKEAVIIDDELDENPEAVANRLDAQKEKVQQAQEIEILESIATRQQR